MSPTILRERGFNVVIFLNDHPPPHVHVLKAGKRARVFLAPVALWDSNLPANETRLALRIVEANRDTLLDKWRDIHGTDE